jgi:hypothetical protein
VAGDNVMLRGVIPLFVLFALCSTLLAQDLAAERLVSLCFYDIASEICDLPINADDRKRLDGAKAKVAGRTDQSVSAASLTCAKLKQDVQRQAASFCTPELKAYFYQTLKLVSDE